MESIDNKDEKIDRIIICGKAASGKDYLREGFILERIPYNVSLTTRSKRNGEIAGRDYHFVTSDYFGDIIKRDGFYEHDTFSGWQYGTLKCSWESSTVFIMTPRGVKSILPEDKKRSFIVYLDIDEKTRRERLMSRGGADTIERRMEADEKDFIDIFPLVDEIIIDPFFNREALIKHLMEIVNGTTPPH